MRIVSLIMAVVFVGFASVQFNDPDGLVWIVAYGLSAVFSAYAALRTPPSSLAMMLAVSYTLWAVWLLPHTRGLWWSGEIEREVSGLVICAAWNLILFRHARHIR